uniref:Putative secreted protein n=1 Tax=Anopheles darlingi TaxID=43151 RepID=A0A2M4DLS5_ANODA
MLGPPMKLLDFFSKLFCCAVMAIGPPVGDCASGGCFWRCGDTEEPSGPAPVICTVPVLADCLLPIVILLWMKLAAALPPCAPAMAVLPSVARF